MNESTAAIADNTSSPTPGAILAEKRRSFGWSIEQVANLTKLAPKQIEALESDHYGVLPDIATARGFLRAYAKVLKLDVNALTALLAEDCQNPARAPLAQDELLKPITASAGTLPDAREARIGRPLFLVLGLVFILLVVVLADMAGLFEKRVKEGERESAKAEQTVIPAAPNKTLPTTTPEAAVPMPTLVQQPTPTATATPTPGHSTAAPAQTPPPQAAPAVTASAPPGAQLMLSVSADSWVEVRGQDGSVSFSKLLKAGTQQTIPINPPARLVIGNVAGTTVEWRGQAIDLKTANNNNIARINLE